MREVNGVVSVHGGASIRVLTQEIEKALAVGNDAEALRLDEVLQNIERLMQGGHFEEPCISA
jgi:hypothetical protein